MILNPIVPNFGPFYIPVHFSLPPILAMIASQNIDEHFKRPVPYIIERILTLSSIMSFELFSVASLK